MKDSFLDDIAQRSSVAVLHDELSLLQDAPRAASTLVHLFYQIVVRHDDVRVRYRRRHRALE